MVCNRCILVVRQLFDGLGYSPVTVELGEVETAQSLSPDELLTLRERLNNLGFELIDDAKSQLIEKVKTLLVGLVHHSDGEELKVNYSEFLASSLNKDYHYLSNLFSEITGTTIEKFIILQKIERVKELLVYNEMTLSEIAWEVGYSSVAHLSAQFKKVTGLTPAHFKKIGAGKRKPLDQL